MKRKLFCGILSFCLIFCETASVLNAESRFVGGGFGGLSGILPEEDGRFIVTDIFDNVIREIKNGKDTIIAGKKTSDGADGTPKGGYKDGVPSKALFSSPWAIITFSNGFAVSDSENHTVRYISENKVSSFDIKLNNPTGLAADEEGNLYISDTGENVIYRLDKNNKLSVWADGFNEPTGLCLKNGVMYVADSGNHRICMVKDGVKTVVSGTTEGFANGKAENAKFSSPQGVAVDDDGVIYVADTGNAAVRKISDGIVTTLISGEDGKTWPVAPRGIAVKGSRVFVSDAFAGVVFSENAEGEVFSDVPNDSDYYEAIKNICALGILDMENDGNFHPDDFVTREEMVVAICKMKKMYDCSIIISGSHNFSDVDKDSEYSSYIGNSFEDGIINGTSGESFSPKEDVTRQEAVTMLYRFLKAKPLGKNVSSDSYKDRKNVADWAADAVDWAVLKNIITADENGLVNPEEKITKKQAAQMLYRIFLIN